MASKATATLAFLVSLNLLFFSMVTSAYTCPIANLSDLKCCALSGVALADPTACLNLLGPLSDGDAAVCLCLALNAGVCGLVSINLDLYVSLVLGKCNKSVPSDCHCT